ncbi:MAG: isoprenylcysteine carboxylmethyltransferase family protein [Actinomycetia bacterium]|nr:isoprenylcysteine carboxylmethyltransferase family protein [Actinomycetes bacterium]
MSRRWFRREHALAVVSAVALERLAELVVARRNEQWAREHGGVEHGAGHYPVMVALHSGFLAAIPLEAILRDRQPPRSWPLLLGAAIGAQALRWWCISTLGPRWNTKVIVLPEEPPIVAGPYELLDHPNYVAVVVEGAALPLLAGASRTATVFSVANAFLLRHRIRVEDAALGRRDP